MDFLHVVLAQYTPNPNCNASLLVVVPAVANRSVQQGNQRLLHVSGLWLDEFCCGVCNTTTDVDVPGIVVRKASPKPPKSPDEIEADTHTHTHKHIQFAPDRCSRRKKPMLAQS